MSEPNASIIISYAGWHERDPYGYLIINEHSDNWLIINMPALAENEAIEPDNGASETHVIV